MRGRRSAGDGPSRGAHVEARGEHALGGAQGGETYIRFSRARAYTNSLKLKARLEENARFVIGEENARFVIGGANDQTGELRLNNCCVEWTPPGSRSSRAEMARRRERRGGRNGPNRMNDPYHLISSVVGECIMLSLFYHRVEREWSSFSPAYTCTSEADLLVVVLIAFSNVLGA